MNEYIHHVSGFFADHDDAETTLSTLAEQGLPRERMHIYSDNNNLSSPEQEAKSDRVLKDILVDGAIGTAVGTGAGALTTVALTAGSVSLFFVNPLVAPLMLLGWGASIGGLMGAITGAAAGSENKEGWLSDLIGDAIANGQVVLVVETRNEQETATAREVIKDAVGKYNDTNMATTGWLGKPERRASPRQSMDRP
jgi:hypothetical protein